MAAPSAPSPSPSWDKLHKPTYYLAGTCLFSLSNLCAQPFTLLKRRQQMGLVPTNGSGGTFRLLHDIAKMEGIAGLFRSSSIAWVPGGARMLYFTVYEHVADFLGSNAVVQSHHHHHIIWPQHAAAAAAAAAAGVAASSISEAADDSTTTTLNTSIHPGWVYGAAGGISTFASQLVMAPYSVISSRLQIATGPKRLSAIAVLRDVVSRPNNGIRALWTGYYSAIAQLGPQHATMWAVSAWLQNQLVVLACDDDVGAEGDDGDNAEEMSKSSSCSRSSNNSGEYSPGLLARLGTSMCGSFVAIVVTSPLDAVRTHRQIMISHYLPPPPSSITASSSLSDVGGHHIAVPSSWSTFVLLYRQQGWRAFTNGIVPRALANCPGMIAMMVGYQYVKQLAEHVQRRQ